MNYLDFFKSLNENRSYDFKVFNCGNCSINLSFNNIENICPYCLSNLNTFEIQQKIKPDYLLPIKIDQNQAIVFLLNWLNKSYFIDKKLKKHIKNKQNIKCVYIPYWLFNIKTSNTIKTRQDKIPNKVIDKDLNDIISKASSYDVLEKTGIFEVWNILEIQKYEIDIITKSIIEIYNIKPEESFKYLKENINSDLKLLIENDLESNQKLNNIKTDYKNIEFSHLLIPIWLINYLHKNKNYIYLINAQNGDIIGEKIYNKSILYINISIIIIIILVNYFIY